MEMRRAMDIEIRLEQLADYREVENLTREAFWDMHEHGADEHLLAHKLRKSAAFVPQLDMVAVNSGRIIGNIMYSVAKVVQQNGTQHELLTFGPLSVLPAYKGHGIGSLLVRHTLELAGAMQYRGVVIFGHPEYYPRFGFKQAKDFGITTDKGENMPPFMALELYPEALLGIAGKFYIDPVFEIDTAELAEFEKQFSQKKVSRKNHA